MAKHIRLETYCIIVKNDTNGSQNLTRLKCSEVTLPGRTTTLTSEPGNACETAIVAECDFDLHHGENSQKCRYHYLIGKLFWEGLGLCFFCGYVFIEYNIQET